MTADRPGKITFGHLVSLGSRLTDRDRQIALDCYDHHVLTTEQLVRLHFAGLRTATARLDALYKLRVLDRFRPPARPPSVARAAPHITGYSMRQARISSPRTKASSVVACGDGTRTRSR